MGVFEPVLGDCLYSRFITLFPQWLQNLLSSLNSLPQFGQIMIFSSLISPAVYYICCWTIIEIIINTHLRKSPICIHIVEEFLPFRGLLDLTGHQTSNPIILCRVGDIYHNGFSIITLFCFQMPGNIVFISILLNSDLMGLICVSLKILITKICLIRFAGIQIYRCNDLRKINVLTFKLFFYRPGFEPVFGDYNCRLSTLLAVNEDTLILAFILPNISFVSPSLIEGSKSYSVSSSPSLTFVLSYQ